MACGKMKFHVWNQVLPILCYSWVKSYLVRYSSSMMFENGLAPENSSHLWTWTPVMYVGSLFIILAKSSDIPPLVTTYPCPVHVHWTFMESCHHITFHFPWLSINHKSVPKTMVWCISSVSDAFLNFFQWSTNASIKNSLLSFMQYYEAPQQRVLTHNYYSLPLVYEWHFATLVHIDEYLIAAAVPPLYFYFQIQQMIIMTAGTIQHWEVAANHDI